MNEIEISQEIKDRMKQERLTQYQAQLYSLEMDLKAYEAVGDQNMIEQTQKAIEQGKKAYQAVKGME